MNEWEVFFKLLQEKDQHGKTMVRIIVVVRALAPFREKLMCSLRTTVSCTNVPKHDQCIQFMLCEIASLTKQR